MPAFTGYQKENPLYKSLSAGARGLGTSLPKFQNISKPPVQPQAQPQAQAPINERFKNLGAITTPYGGSTRYEQYHPGVDIANKPGTPIKAFTGGTVTDARSGMGRSQKPSFGNYVVIKDDKGNYHRYSHLTQGYVPVGSQVQAGQQLGTMGYTGSTYSTSGGTGSHLDYRIYSAAKKYYNPSKYLSNY